MKPIEVVFSFDTTGSMSPCLAQVRKKVKETITRLTKEIPNISFGIIVHGDYCDEDSTYLLKKTEISNKIKEICDFVTKVSSSGGGDAPEAYEYALNQAREMNWTDKATKVLVLIGDEVPHSASYNKRKLDWKKEAKALADDGVIIYGVQALGRKSSTKFYKELAKIGNGIYLTLDQFANIIDLIMTVCYKQASDDMVLTYEKEVRGEGRMNRSLLKIFDAVLERKGTKEFDDEDLHAVEPGRFQVLEVDDDSSIMDYVHENGLTFKTGRGFYEFTKTETIQAYKEVILMDKKTGDLFEGEKARDMLDLPDDEEVRLKPVDLAKWMVFVQSMSYNRKLISGTHFLYEVEDWDKTYSVPRKAKGKKTKAKSKKKVKVKAR